MPRLVESMEPKPKRKKRSSSSSDDSPSEKRKKKSKKVLKEKKKSKRRKFSQRSSTSSDSDSSLKHKHKKHKHKKKKSKETSPDRSLKAKHKHSKSRHVAEEAASNSVVGPRVSDSSATSCKGPMTKEMWEKQQSVVRRVYDPDTGRTRLVKGSGEIVEEIVSKEQQRQINKLATQGDGISYSLQTGTLKK